MKLRITLGFLALVAIMVFGLGSLPVQAHAATAVTLSATDLGNMQSVLNVTKVTLDAVQVQINHNAIQDRSATLAILGSIRSYLLNMRALLGGEPIAAGIPMTFEDPEPVAFVPAPVAPQAPAEPVAPVASVTPAPVGEVAGSAMVNKETEPSQQTASVSSSATSQRAFWIILITAIVIAIILVIPRKKETVAMQDAPQSAPQAPQTQPQSSEGTEPAQSA